MKIATWNVNSIKARIERLAAFLEREKPDVLCLQELKCVEEMFPLPAIHALGYHAAISGQKTYNGVALVTKKPVKDVERGFGDDSPDTAARHIAATIDGIRVMSVYVPNGQSVGSDKYEYKLDWMKRFRKYLDKNHTPKDKLVIAGDFNVAPEDRDVYNPEAWRDSVLFSEPEKKALRKIAEFGLEDAFRLHHDEAGAYTWWDYRMLAFPKGRGLRIDHILLTKGLAKKCTSTRIDRDERKGKLPSDHAPLIAELNV